MYDAAQTAFPAARKLRLFSIRFLQGVHHGRSYTIYAAREPQTSSASFAPNSAIPRSTVGYLRGTLGKKHRRLEFVPADGMCEGNGQNGLGLYDLIGRLLNL
jgi:hypothetical protein